MNNSTEEDLEDCFAEDDLKRLIKAVFESSLVDYIKLQHSKNRNKKFLEESFANSVDMFFDDSFRFEHFQDLETQTKNLSFLELMECFLNTKNIKIENVHEHIAKESINYWWDKNFHNLEVPTHITISGIVWTIVNSPSQAYIDHSNKRIYCPVKQIDSDKKFLTLCLRLICEAADLNIKDEDFEKLFKVFYLFLKINSPFKQRKK